MIKILTLTFFLQSCSVLQPEVFEPVQNIFTSVLISKQSKLLQESQTNLKCATVKL